MNLVERRGVRLATFCLLYCAQGIPWGFMAITLPAYLGERGLDAADIGAVLAMTTVPYSFKTAWGPIIDTITIPRLGRRRPWILLAQAMMTLTVAVLIFIPDLTRDITLLTWLIFIHTTFNSMQDVATDALAVDLLSESERGRTNGLMYGSKFAGGVFGGAGMTFLINWQSLRIALLIQTCVLLAITIVPLLMREYEGIPPERTPFRVLFRTLLKAARTWQAVMCGIVMLAQGIASGMLTAIAVVLFTQELKWDSAEYAELVGGPSLVVALAGAVIGGFLADKVGHRRLAVLSSLGLALVWFTFSATETWWTERAFVYCLFVLEPLFLSTMMVSLFALCMDVSWKQIGATQFAAYMSIANISTTIGFRLAGHAQVWWSFRETYVVAAALQVLAAGLIVALGARGMLRSRKL